MCEPIITAAASAMAAMNMATSYFSIKSRNDAANAEAEAAVNAANADYVLLNKREEQVNSQAALEERERMEQGMRERSKMRVAMGESGLTGNSMLRQISSSFVDESWDVGIIDANRTNEIEGIEAQKIKTYSDAQGRVNSAKSKITNPFMAGLQIGGAGFQGASSGAALGKSLRK